MKRSFSSTVVTRRIGRPSPRRIPHFESMELRLACDAALAADTAASAAEGESTPIADFRLVDLNPESPRFQQTISPRDYLRQVSAWYFSHST